MGSCLCLRGYPVRRRGWGWLMGRSSRGCASRRKGRAPSSTFGLRNQRCMTISMCMGAKQGNYLLPALSFAGFRCWRPRDLSVGAAVATVIVFAFSAGGEAALWSAIRGEGRLFLSSCEWAGWLGL